MTYSSRPRTIRRREAQTLLPGSFRSRAHKSKSFNNSIPFLDILVKQVDKSSTQTTNLGHYLIGRSRSPQWCTDSTIGANVRRPVTNCSTWQQAHNEIECPPQVLLNNGFRLINVSRQTKKVGKQRGSSLKGAARQPHSILTSTSEEEAFHQKLLMKG